MLTRVLFTVVSLTIQAAFYYFVWRRLIRDTALPKRPRRLVSTVLWSGYALFPLAIWSNALGLSGIATWLGWFVFPMTAFVGLAAAFLLITDSARLSLWVRRRLAPKHGTPSPASVIDPARREFLARATGASAVAVVTGGMAYGSAHALGEPVIERVTIALDRWPAALAGLTIAHLTDLHAGFTVSREYVQRVVDRTNALAPDLIFVTGDMVDGQVAVIGDRTAPLGDLRARLGVFGVTGNHEYYSGADEWIAEFERLGIRMLRNEHVVMEDRGTRFLVVGIDDHMARAFPGHGADIKKAMRGAPRDIAGLLLAHQPKQVKSAIFRNLDLQLSGHTHGGQVWPWHFLAAAQQDGLLAGLYKRGGTTVYVGRGAGYWGPPIRVGASPEIGLLSLIPGKS